MTMNCKYCNAELVEGMPFCPSCGKNQTVEEETVVEVTEEVTAEAVSEEETVQTPAEETVSEEIVEEPAAEQSSKKTPGKIAAAVVAGILVLAILIGMIAGGTANKGGEASVEPTTVTAEPVEIPSNGDPASALCKETYTVTNEEAAAAADTVVATMGDKVLTNGELQAYYWMEVSLFLQEYGSYAQYIGLDLYSPLDQQVTDAGETPMSWQQFFLDSAIYTWKTYQSLELEAEADGFEMPEERREELEALPANLEQTALAGGYESVNDLVTLNIGHGATLQNYVDYVQTYYQGMSYYYDIFESMEPAAEEIEAFYAENEEHYAQSGITKGARYVDIRHVLLQPEGGETGADGSAVYTDEAWEACRQKAEELYNQWQAGDKSEESFAILANENTADGNDVNGDGQPDGGLYENVYAGQMVQEFNDWCFDEARQSGDHGLVKTRYGYHIMYFCDTRPIQYVDVRHVLLQPEGGEADEYGYPVFTEEAWEACRQQAEEIYNQWQAGDKSEDSFAQLAMEYSVDSNAATGGLYEGVTMGQMVDEFEDWCFDDVRVVGDHGLVKTQYGYHIMFFCGKQDAWYAQAKADLIEDVAFDMIPATIEKYPADVDYSLMVLGEVQLG